MQIYSRTYKGFTLLEVIVVVAIVSIMVAVTLAYVGGSRSREVSRAASLKLEESLKEVQNNALVGKMVGSEYACAFGVVKKDFASEYILVYIKKDLEDGCKGVVYDTDEATEYATVRLPEGTYIESFENILFALPHAVLYQDGEIVEEALEFQVRNADATEMQYVCLDEKGDITNNGEDPC